MICYFLTALEALSAWNKARFVIISPYDTLTENIYFYLSGDKWMART